MKITALVTDIGRTCGGLQKFNAHLLEGVVSHGHTVSVVSLGDRSVPVLDPAAASFVACGAGGPFRKIIFVWRALQVVLRQRPDAVLCAHAHLLPVCVLLQFLTRTPFLAVCHGIESWHLRLPQLWALQRARAIVCVSSYTRQQVLKQLVSYPVERTALLANTVDTNRFVPREKSRSLRERLGIKDDESVVLTVARLDARERYKGYDDILRVFPEVLKERPQTVYLLVGDGSDVERIKRLVGQLGLSGRVIMPGFVSDDDLVDYYNLCDVYAMPSTGEGFGIVFLEALSCGKPVIASDQDASAEVLGFGELGTIVPGLKPQLLQKAIIGHLSGQIDPALRDGEQLRAKVAARYGKEEFKRNLEALFERLKLAHEDVLRRQIDAKGAAVIRPSGFWGRLSLRELMEYRELLFFLVWRDVKVRYKQTAIGVLWAVLQPFVTMVVFSLFFRKLMKMPSEGNIPYAVFSYAGLLIWTYFSSAVSSSGNSLINNAYLITRVYFPRIIIPLAAALGGLFDYAIALVILFFLMAFYGIAPNALILLLPVVVFMAFFTVVGFGLWLAALNVRYRDIRYGIPFFIQMLLFISPVIYPVTVLPDRFRWVLALNPVGGVINFHRACLLGYASVDLLLIGVSFAVSFVLFVTGLVYFRRTERTFADLI